ncbi:MAG: DUF4968 domain-containing protein, partial [Caldilineaceae bacterium]|nr:DUF4968 domain-containing protein [Caldilineaceae bacterium]
MDHVPASFPVPLFLDQSMPVELASELVQLDVDGHSVRVHCATQHYEPEVFDYYGTLCETILTPATTGRPFVIQLDVCTDAIVRMRMAPEGEPFPPPTPMVVGQFDGPTHFQLHRAGDRVTIETALLRLEIVHEPLQLLIYDRDGNLIWATRALDIACLRRPEVQWNPAENRWLFYHRYAYPLGWAAHGGIQRAFLSSDLHYDEHIYGFGEGFGRLDKRETRQRLWNVEAFGNASPGA